MLFGIVQLGNIETSILVEYLALQKLSFEMIFI